MRIFHESGRNTEGGGGVCLHLGRGPIGFKTLRIYWDTCFFLSFLPNFLFVSIHLFTSIASTKSTIPQKLDIARFGNLIFYIGLEHYASYWSKNRISPILKGGGLGLHSALCELGTIPLKLPS